MQLIIVVIVIVIPKLKKVHSSKRMSLVNAMNAHSSVREPLLKPILYDDLLDNLLVMLSARTSNN